MARFVRISTDREEVIAFHCPGCNGGHSFRIRGGGPIWIWDGNLDRGTFSPSLLVRYYNDPQDREKVTGVCHSFVRGGKIEFLGDCTHALRGQTVDIPEDA